MAASRAKGKRGELGWRDWLREHGFRDARRGQQRAGGPDSPDVVDGIPGTHVEVKFAERLRLYDAVRQAVRDSEGGAVPYVAHRRSREEWLVTVRADDLFAFVRAVASSLPEAELTGGWP